MSTDKKIHDFYDALKDVAWQSFQDSWFDDYEREHECYDYYDYYYAEDELYIIRDRLRDNLFFVKARSPYKAYMKHSALCTEVSGGIHRGRDYKYEDFVKDICCECQNYEDCDRLPIDYNGELIADFRENCRDFEPVEHDYGW